MPFDVLLKIIKFFLIPLKILFLKVGIQTLLIIVKFIGVHGRSWFKWMQFPQNQFKLLFVKLVVKFDKFLNKGW